MLFDMGVIQAIAEEGRQGNAVSGAALVAKLDCDQSPIGESVLYCSVDLEGTSLFRVSAVRLLRLLTADTVMRYSRKLTDPMHGQRSFVILVS